jgi:hypothetical protein
MHVNLTSLITINTTKKGAAKPDDSFIILSGFNRKSYLRVSTRRCTFCTPSAVISTMYIAAGRSETFRLC